MKSDGSTASYYELPEGAKELQDLISYRNMNGQVAECFRSLYRYGIASHSDRMRDIKKVIFYANAELDRLIKYEMNLGGEADTCGKVTLVELVEEMLDGKADRCEIAMLSTKGIANVEVAITSLKGGGIK